MFLIRSAFWLTVAFLVIRPGVDVGATADALSASAIRAGQEFIAQQIEATDCTDLQCAGAKAVISIALSSIPSAEATMQAPATSSVPFPRPRPDWMG
jgi:hypothetical protein